MNIMRTSKLQSILIVFCLLLSITGLSQDTTTTKSNSFDSSVIVFSRVEVEAEFPGGLHAWAEFLKKNLKSSTPIKHKAPNGTYQVIVRFIVSRNGDISDIVSETNHGFGMEAEVIRVIKKCPKWNPAYQNGRSVNAYRRQPVTFIVSDK